MNKNKLKTHANLGESDGNGNDDVPIDSLFASGRTEVPKTIGNNSSFLQKSIPPNNNRGCAACPTLSHPKMKQNALAAATAGPVGISSTSPVMGFPQQQVQQHHALLLAAQMQQNALAAATAGQLAVGSTASPMASLHAPNKRLQPIKASAASSRKGKRDDQKEEEAAKVYHEYRTLTDEERITLLGGEARGLPGIMQKVGFDDECCKDKATQRRVRRREEKMRKEGERF